ncbi:unnamed protein product [Mytilus edulis]|uniref:Fibrocystin-L n=1 Tax=Mytilus edulis TaxID=6550 RepID=A0A8S3R7C6_MYTED|nr:unnamed protein product [Mytilus edulis]
MDPGSPNEKWCPEYYSGILITVHGVTPNKGSLNGETRLTIDGKGFSEDQYNEGNEVKLVSSTAVYDCPVHKDGSTEVQIMCYTPQRMVADDYYIRVSVDGKDVPLSDHCNGNANSGDCRFTATQSVTPTITQVEPISQASLPGVIIKLYGKIYSGVYGSNVPSDEITNGITERILRVYAHAQLCELRGENDTFHGLELDNDGSSTNGYMKCLTKGTFVGNTNASFILEGQYGRSMPDADLLRVSSKDDIYMFQTYAKVTGVNPSTGSVKGGTLITISGEYFDETNSAVRVLVGGTECEVTDEVTDSQIICRTAAQLSAPRYAGNRGLNYEQFSSTYHSFADLPNVADLLTNATDYSSSVIDEFYFDENDLDEYSTRTHGYFIPPHTGQYTLHIKCDDAAILYLSTDEDPANKVQEASCPKYSSKWTSNSEQTSRRMQLIRDKYYYIEVLHSENTIGSNVRVAARHLDTKFVSPMTGFAKEEIQKIKVTSTVEREIQQVTVSDLTAGSATNEVQEVTVEENSGSLSDATYQLCIYGVCTKMLQTITDGADIGNALSELPCFDSTESVSVTSTTLSSGAPGAKLTVTFNSERVRVSEKTSGVPSGKYFTLTMESIPTPLIAADASAGDVKTALEELFGTRCPSFLTSPAAKKKFINYESGLPSGVRGTKTNEVEPFCGRYVVKNPNYLYNGGDLKLSSSVTTLCFAYQGNQLQNYVRVSYTYEDDAEELHNSAINIDVAMSTTEGWHYTCIDMLSELKSARPTIAYFWVRKVQVYKLGSAKQFYIDDVYIGREAVLTNSTDVNFFRMTPAKPNSAFIESVSVASPSTGVYDITLVPHDCGSDFPLFKKIAGQVRSGGSISVTRTQPASPPITGSFSVTFNSKTKAGISYDMDEAQLTTMLETIEGIGNVKVTRTGVCSNFDITIAYESLPGDQAEIIVDASTLFGKDVAAVVTTIQDGGLWYDPIPGDMLRTDHELPQVMVYVNGIPTICEGDCSFEWSLSSSSTVTAISPTSGGPGISVVVSGTNFGAVLVNNEVEIGGVMCTVTSGSTTSLTCTTGQGSYGTYLVDVYVDGKGKATHDAGNVTFQNTMAISGINPTTGTLGGGIPITITGNGFSSSAVVTVGGNDCEILSSTTTQIVCNLPAATAGSVDVVVTLDGHTQTSPTQFTYDSSSTPTITSVSPTSIGAAGGATLTIDGTNFGTSGTLKIGTTTVATDTFTNTQVTATLPSLAPGIYDVLLLKGSGGAAVDSSGNIPKIEYKLVIKNIFPTEGSLHGGTRLTLTGQGFSTNMSLTEVKVGDYGCDIESATTTQIVCLIPDTSAVIKINNQGVHPTWGIGYQWNPVVALAKVGDILEWSWTTPSWIYSFTHRIEQTKNETATEPAVDGFVSGQVGTANGGFQHRVTTPGEFSYWSGYTDLYEIIFYRGTLVVEDKTPFSGLVELKVAGQMALHDVNSGTSDPVDGSACPGTTSPISNCAGSPPISSPPDMFSYSFKTCTTPGVTAIDKNRGTTNDVISITGYGFSSTSCNNEVTFGDATCTVTNSADTWLECKIDPTSSPTVGLMQEVNVRVNNLGDAIIAIAGQSAKTFVIEPLVTEISPLSSSVNGGLTLTISGTGYQGNVTDVLVSINGIDCPVQTVSYTEITCITPPSGGGIKTVEVKVNAYGNLIPAVCDILCQLTYEPADTPEISAVDPMTLSGASITVTISGTGFSDQAVNTEVKIGGEVCTASSVTDSEIQCTITNVPAGTQDLDLVITDKGRATNSIQITSSAVISSLSPSQGSTNGGTELIIDGNGFVDGSTSVTVDGTACDLVEVALSYIKCKTKSHATGSVDVVVTSNGQTYGNESFEYSSSATPTISSVSPIQGSQGTTITITGTNFGAGSGDNTVTTGGVPCTVTSDGATEIQCTAGAVSIGSVPVLVDVKNSGLSNNDVNFEFELTITAINKNSGSSSGGQTVTITGSGFDDTTSATICGNPCAKDDSASQTASQFICVTPAASGTVTGTQACDVIATVDGVSKTLAGGYTYDQSLTPTITNVNPARGGTGGGSTLTITGTGFGNNPAQVDVTIAGTTCTVSTATDTQIVCTTGQHTPSQKTSVTVEINGNGIADQTDAEFYYVDVWSSPFTWGGGSPPENGTLVVIPAGNVILLDINTNRLKMILIKGGELIFDEKDVELFADNILIVEGGKLQIGTEDQPFQHKAIITGTAHLRTKELPIYGTNSLGVREGILDLHVSKLGSITVISGQPVPVVWTRLDQTAAAGTNQIVLQKEVTWKAGEEIVIASTGHHHTQRENEVRIIQSVAGDQKTITLTKNLDYTHLGTSETISGYNLEYRAEVGLLTRNIVLRGERDRQWTEVIAACPAGFNTGEFATQTCFQGRFGEEIGSDQFGIQVMLHPPEPNKDLAIGRVSYVEFTYAGQAFRLGRYPFHFHLGGNMSSSYIKGCALHETFNRAVNIHGTHNALIENNVIYNVMGGAFFLEDGIETNNTIQYNLAVFVRESTSLLNDDVTPASFWVTNPNNIIQHNSAAGGSHFGFWYRMHPHPEGPSRTNSICPQKELMGVFTNNTAHSFGWFGLWIFETFLPKEGGGCGSNTPTPAVFNNFYAWNNDKGAESVNTGAVQFHDFILVNNKKAGYEQKKSLEGEFYTQNGPLFKDGFIVGRSPALSNSVQGCTNAGIVMPYFYRFMVDGTEFANFNEGGCSCISWTSIAGTSGPENGGFEYHTQNLIFTNVGANNRGHFRWKFEGLIIDRDGTLSGTPNGTIVPTADINPPSCSHLESFSHGVPASLCPPGVKFIRFSNNNIKPTSIDYKAMRMNNTYGAELSSWQKKRMTHKKAG